MTPEELYNRVHLFPTDPDYLLSYTQVFCQIICYYKRPALGSFVEYSFSDPIYEVWLPDDVQAATGIWGLGIWGGICSYNGASDQTCVRAFLVHNHGEVTIFHNAEDVNNHAHLLEEVAPGLVNRINNRIPEEWLKQRRDPHIPLLVAFAFESWFGETLV